MFERYILLTQSAASEHCISKLRSRENEKVQALQDELASIEAESSGTLYWRKRGNKINFWRCHEGKQQGLTKNINKIYSLARKMYLRVFLSEIRILNCSEWIASIDKLLQSFSAAGLDIMRIILTNAQYEWASHPQSQKTNRLEELKYKTNGGIYVRSKSEQFIGNILEELGIPYRYEPALRIGNRVLHPDFVIMTVDNRKIILEHFGRMDLEEYVSAAIDRLAAYNYHNLLIGRDVFISFESDIKSREDLMPIIYQIMAA